MTRRLELLDGLVYADLFDCALTLEEVWRFSRTPIGLEELRSELRHDDALSGLVIHRGGFYSLADRPELIEQRPRRMARARALQRRGRRIARVLRHLPFVRGLALTGSLAADDARETADVDLLVVAAPGRLATVFLLMGTLARVLRGRLFCPNFYVTDGRLGMAPGDLYTARELAQARSLAGSAAGLREANPWLASVFPNARAGEPELPRDGRVQRLLELPLRGRIGARVEAMATPIAAARLRAHYAATGGPVPQDVAESFAAGVSLRFHAFHTGESMLARYAARRHQVAARLAGHE